MFIYHKLITLQIGERGGRQTDRQTYRKPMHSGMQYGPTENQALIFCGFRVLIFVYLIKYNVCLVYVVVLFLMLIVFIKHNCQSQHSFIIVSDHLACDVPFFVPKENTVIFQRL